MSITIFTQSKKHLAPIYIRVREGGNSAIGKGIDAKAKTQFSINPNRLEKGKFKDYKTPKGANANKKLEYKEKQQALTAVRENIQLLISKINSRLNNRKDYEIINSAWLKEVVNPQKESTTTLLHDYFDVYFKSKKSSIRQSTISKLGSIQKRLKHFEDDNRPVYIAEVDKIFKTKLFNWLDNNGYGHNTKVQMLKNIVTICNHSRDNNGLKTHPDLLTLTKDEKYKKTPHVFLNKKDLVKIKNTTLDSTTLNVARDWLLISCETGQRISDFLKFSKSNIENIDGDLFLNIEQEKTETPVYIYLTENVTEILTKYNNEFPPMFSKNIDSNETIYNRLIKEVCRLSDVKELVKANMRQTKTNRYKIVEIPKFKAVSSHIGRRSFATNYYGRLPTELLMSVTGHKTEKQFLDYVNLPPISKAKDFARAYKMLKVEQDKPIEFEVIKNAQ
jgi:outer membrane protein OmpA-like peptidoglycan-associated protein